MEFLSSLPKTIAEVGYKIFSDRSAATQAKKQRFADLVERIAECTKKIGDSIYEGNHATVQCAEISRYVDHIKSLALEVTDKETADNLLFWLYYVEAVPSAAKRNVENDLAGEIKPPWTKHRRYIQSREVLEISGTLNAVANLLRV